MCTRQTCSAYFQQLVAAPTHPAVFTFFMNLKQIALDKSEYACTEHGKSSVAILIQASSYDLQNLRQVLRPYLLCT